MHCMDVAVHGNSLAAGLTVQRAEKSFTDIRLISSLDAGSLLPPRETYKIGSLPASSQAAGTKGLPSGLA